MQKLKDKVIPTPTLFCNKCGKELKNHIGDCVTIDLHKMMPIPDNYGYYKTRIGCGREDLCKTCTDTLYQQLQTIINTYRASYVHPFIPPNDD